MRNPAFPDSHVAEYIEALAEEFSFNVVERKYTHHTQMSNLMKEYKDDKWVWVLSKTGSPVRMHISASYPGYIVLISFENTSEEIKQKMSNYFFFDKYLWQQLNDSDDAHRLDDIVSNRSWREDWRKPLETLKNHLRIDLLPIVDGHEWPNIEFRLEDYVEPSALDRMYDDSKKTLDRKPGAWVYFLSFFRKK